MRHFAGKPVRFLIVGGGRLDIPPGVDERNLHWCDDLDAVYRNATVLVRFTQRDGLSLMVLEALAYGRYVVWSQPFEFSTRASNYEEIRSELERLLDLHLKAELAPRSGVADTIRRRFDVKRCVADIADAWTIALGAPHMPVEAPQTYERAE